MKIIGHRGAKGLAPENTLASFGKAMEHQVDEIECDVRVTSDGVAILEHDVWLKNQAGEQLKVTDHTYDELKLHKPELATLEEGIRYINRAVPLYIEVKRRQRCQPVIDCLQKLLLEGWHKQDFLLASDSFKTLSNLKAGLPELPLLVIEAWSGTRATYYARRLGTKRLSMDQRWLWRGFLVPMARRGWQISPYTLNDPNKAKRWVKYGIFGVVTDYPDLYQDKS